MERGRRRGRLLTARAIGELRAARIVAGLSHAEIAHAIGVDRSIVTRLEHGAFEDLGIVRLSEIASVLGYEVSVGLHPIGDPLRDKEQLACARRFDALISNKWRVTDETLLPGAGEQRAWDKLLRLVTRRRATWSASTSRAASGMSKPSSGGRERANAMARSTTS